MDGAGPGMLGDVPFTLSHLAAVLPLRSGRTRVEALPTAPLVIGSMVPDLPAVLGAGQLRPVTHTGPFALAVDLGLTAAIWCCWVVAVRPAVAGTLPELAARWVPRRTRRPAVVWWVAAAVIGSVTHLVWDAFTHSSEGSTFFAGFAPHQRFFLALQLLSSVLGLLAVLLWARGWWRRTAGCTPDATRALAGGRRQVTAAGVTVVTVGAAAIWRWQHPSDVVQGRASHSVQVGDVVFGALAGGLLAVVVLTAGFWVGAGLHALHSSRRSRRSRRPDVQDDAAGDRLTAG